jgi:hypothetical protein
MDDIGQVQGNIPDVERRADDALAWDQPFAADMPSLVQLAPGQLDALLPSLSPAAIAKICSGLSLPQLRSLRPDQLSSLSAILVMEQFARLSMTQLAGLHPRQLAQLSDGQRLRLLAFLVPEFDPDQAERLPAGQWTGLLDYLSPQQIARFLPWLTTEQIRLLRPVQLSALSALQIAVICAGLAPGQLVHLLPAQLAKLSASQLSRQLPYLTAHQAARLFSDIAEDDVKLLRADQLAMLSAQQVTDGFSRLSMEQLIMLTPLQLARLTPEQRTLLLQGIAPGLQSGKPTDLPLDRAARLLPYLTPAEAARLLEQLPAGLVRRLRPDQLVSLTANQVAQVFALLSSVQLAALSPDQLYELSSGQLAQLLAMLPRDRLSPLMASMPIAQLAQVEWRQSVYLLPYLEPARVAKLLFYFPKEKIKTLRPEQLSSLAAEQVRQAFPNLSMDQLARLHPWQLAELSSEERRQVEDYRRRKVLFLQDPEAACGSAFHMV